MRLAPSLPVLVALLAGCGAAPDTIDPSGVDQLTIPTPSPDPADFVRTVDNPYLPLAPGRTWTYRVSGAGRGTVLRVTVVSGTRTIAGVTATGLHEELVTATGRVVAEGDRWYAQDRAGNVWTLGVDLPAYAAEPGESWLAGQAGAQAGLAMAAVPRVGDGYRTGYAPGVAEDVAQVVDADTSVSVPYADFDGALEIEVTSTLEQGTEELTYAEGVGLVRVESGGPAERTLELVTATR
jgi:hypothetical protein